jgi:hypothetical protein
VKRAAACVLLSLVTLAGFSPAAARASTPFAQNTSQASVMKHYLKHQKSARKKLRKSRKKAENRWRKIHHVDH